MEYWPNLESASDESSSLTPSDNRRAKELQEMMHYLESVTKNLQDGMKKLSDVRANLDAVIAQFPNTNDLLRADAKIVLYPLFEFAIVKVEVGDIRMISREEKQVMKVFSQISPINISTEEQGM